MRFDKIFFLGAAAFWGLAPAQGDLSPAQKQLRQQGQAIRKIQKDVTTLQKEKQALADSLKRDSRRLQSSVQSGFDTLGAKIDRNNSVAAKMSERLSVLSDERMSGLESRTRTYFFIAFFLFFTAFAFILLKFVGITKKLNGTEELMRETLQLETKMSELLVGHQSLADEVKKTTGIISLKGIPGKEDHSFYVMVAEEMYRMRSRLTKMPQDTKGWVALTNALSRMENELAMKGYRINDLTGQPYHDEMTALVKEFIPQDDLPEGEQKVLRMIRPQVRHNDTVVSHGEIEVAMSVEDLAQKK